MAAPRSRTTLFTALLLAAAVLAAVSASPVPDPNLRAKRYVVSVPPVAVNLTGWVPAVVPLGQAVFGSRPYIIG
ncbi:hypothetical protein ONE63_002963 [Megalurothrips usitatus]|uniref:Uncharacterized protein n=1 Tax=Megalurothrips usitatus TaxID=439358 RepID=A0AAV7X8W1_9NEOP|nr:hypothetical protein ONE63_002963 [Megalurothrips usitatus]